MNTYNIPRDTTGEGKILYIFSYKALIFTIIGAAIGYIFYFIFKTLAMGTIGLFAMGACAFIGFGIATFKVPRIRFLPVTEFIAGEKIDDCISRYIKFKQKKHVNYVLFEVRQDYMDHEKGYEKPKELIQNTNN